MNDLLPDIPRLYTALAEWMACIVFITILRKRLSGWNLIVLSSGVLILQSVFLVVTKVLPLAFWVPSMIIAFGMMFLLIYMSCEITAIEAGYFSVRAFVAAEFVASLQWQVYLFFGKNDVLLEVFLLIVIYSGLFVLIWFVERRHIPDDGKLNIRHRELWSTVVIGMAIFGMSNLSFVSVRTPFSSQYAQDILNIRTLVDLGGFAILFAYHVQLKELRIKHELEAMRNILQNQYMQYQQSKESIEIINYKYHDLKHQIHILRAEEDADKREAYLTGMENEIKFYEAQNRTGNHVLDTVLASKSAYCMKYGITLTCVADGTLLDGMDVVDISTIFGNALDNAIEYEQKVKEKEKRLIHVSVFEHKGFLMIRFENYFEGKLEYDGDLPMSTKDDSYYHGYGLKSIQYTVSKYDGVVNVGHKDNWFELKVLVPLINIISN